MFHMDSTESSPSAPRFPFEPVPVRPRHDGWTAEKQVALIESLAECGCVLDACRRVGMSAESAYTLKRRIDAVSFRAAWDAALDHAIGRLSDSAFSRSIHGVAVPHFYKGELIGEHRRYDERLTMFLLRYRDPLRYAKSLDRFVYSGQPWEVAIKLGLALAKLRDNEAWESIDEADGEQPDPPSGLAPEDPDEPPLAP